MLCEKLNVLQNKPIKNNNNKQQQKNGYDNGTQQAGEKPAPVRKRDGAVEGGKVDWKEVTHGTERAIQRIIIIIYWPSNRV